MDEVGVMVKKEQDFSDTMDREYRALWTQLTKRQITNADDYTTELFEKQIKSQDEENYARLSCLSTAQNSIKNVLKKTSAMYETANYGVNVLSETVTHAQGEITAFYDRVKTTKHRREDSVASVLRKVTVQKAILDGLSESVLVTKQHSAAVDKLSALLSKLKIAEDVSLTSLKENFEGTILHIKNRASTGDGMRCSIGDFELRTKEMRQVLQKEGALSRLQAAGLAENGGKLEELRIKNTERSNKIIDGQNAQKKSRDLWNSSEMQLSALTDECKSVSEKLANLCDDLSSTEVELTSRTSARQHEFRTEKETMSEKLFEMEQQGAHEREQSTCLSGQLESFRGRYGNNVDIRNWDQIRQEKTIREKGELLASLLSEITTFSNDVAALELSTVDHNKEKMHGEFISVLEGDLIAYMEMKEREEAAAREKNLDSQCRFNAVQKKRAMLEMVYSEREIEHAKLLVENKDFDTQIEAFTTLCTPCKPAGAPTKMGSRKSITAEQLRSQKQNDSDTDDGASSGVRDVEGLQPFSPATISFKERTKSENAARQKISKKPVHLVGNERNVAIAGYSTLDSSKKQLSAIERERSAHDPRNKKDDSLFSSLSDFNDTEKSSASEKYIARRFPNDIFLKPSPSVGRNESVSAGVSAFDQTVDDQSIWSPAQSCKQCNENDIMDMTTETDLDQSVW